jgi:hypothetical protein
MKKSKMGNIAIIIGILIIFLPFENVDLKNFLFLSFLTLGLSEGIRFDVNNKLKLGLILTIIISLIIFLPFFVNTDLFLGLFLISWLTITLSKIHTEIVVFNRSKMGLIFIIISLIIYFLPSFRYTNSNLLLLTAGSLLGCCLFLLSLTSNQLSLTHKTFKYVALLIFFINGEFLWIDIFYPFSPPISIFGMDILTIGGIITVFFAGLTLIYSGTNLARVNIPLSSRDSASNTTQDEDKLIKKEFEANITPNNVQFWMGGAVRILGLVYLILPLVLRYPSNLVILIGLWFFAMGNILVQENLLHRYKTKQPYGEDKDKLYIRIPDPVTGSYNDPVLVPYDDFMERKRRKMERDMKRRNKGKPP